MFPRGYAPGAQIAFFVGLAILASSIALLVGTGVRVLVGTAVFPPSMARAIPDTVFGTLILLAIGLSLAVGALVGARRSGGRLEPLRGRPASLALPDRLGGGSALLRYVIALASGIAILGASSVMLFAFLPAAGISEAAGWVLILVGPVAAGIIIGVLAKSAGAAAGIGFVAGLIGVAIGSTTLPLYLYVSVDLGLIMGVAAGFTAALGRAVINLIKTT